MLLSIDRKDSRKPTCLKLVETVNINVGFFTSFAENRNSEFQPQSYKSETMEEKVAECFQPFFLHTTLAIRPEGSDGHTGASC